MLKNSALIGFTEITIIIVSIIRAKYLAVNIGTEGYGEYSLISSFFSIVTALCYGWIARGTIKYTAEYKQKEDYDSVFKVHNYSISIALLLSTLAMTILFIFRSYISTNFISPNIILWHYSLFTASFLASSLTPFFSWLLQGYILIKKTVILRIVTSIFSLLSVLIFVYLFELTGYYISILVSGYFGLYLYWRETKKLTKTKFLFPDFKDIILKKLLRFGSVNFILLIINSLSDYIQRIIIVNALNIASVGLLQVANSIINYMGVLNRGSMFFNDPKMSQELDIIERNKVLNDFIKFNILIGIPLSVFLIIFSKELISLLYSKSFNPLSSVIYVFIISQYINFIVGGFQSVMLGKAFLKMHSIVSISYSFIIVIISYLTIKRYGLLGIGASLLIANLFTLIVDYVYLRKKIGIIIDSKLISIIFISLLVFTISVYLQSSSTVIRVALFLSSIILVIFSFNKSEREKLYSSIKQILKRNI